MSATRPWFKVEAPGSITSAEALATSPRHQAYLRWLEPYLSPGVRIWSVGSGDGIVESVLLARDHDVLCSDVSIPVPCVVPGNRYVTWDALSGEPPPREADLVLAFSFFFQWDDATLHAIVGRILQGLAPGGRVVCDVSGSPPTWLARAYHSGYLPLERWAVLRRHGIRSVRRQHGYLRATNTLVAAFASHGATLSALEERHDDIEWRRSIVYNRIRRRWPGIAAVGRWAGRWNPYLRLCTFQR